MSQYVEEANQVIILKERGWSERFGFWSNPIYTQRRFVGTEKADEIPYLFTFEQVCKKEGIE